MSDNVSEKSIRAGIVGAAGYTGGELLRLLLWHPNASVVRAHSRSSAGRPVYHVHRDLVGETSLEFTDRIAVDDLDVLFLCTGHGESGRFLLEHQIAPEVRIIDLSQDFRLGESGGGRAFVYGLPELNRDNIRTAHGVANPGCFATAIQLGLLPLAHQGLLGEVYTTGITGSTGAGRSLQETTHFTWRANNISAYKVLTHQHLHEIGRSLVQLQSAFSAAVNFVPLRGGITRGVWISSTTACGLDLADITRVYREFYQSHPFTIVSDRQIDLKQVVNTNKCLIGFDKLDDKLVVHSIIDNLLKGASGQAVQNMNLMFGLDERAGLGLKAAGF